MPLTAVGVDRLVGLCREVAWALAAGEAVHVTIEPDVLEAEATVVDVGLARPHEVVGLVTVELAHGRGQLAELVPRDVRPPLRALVRRGPVQPERVDHRGVGRDVDHARQQLELGPVVDEVVLGGDGLGAGRGDDRHAVPGVAHLPGTTRQPSALERRRVHAAEEVDEDLGVVVGDGAVEVPVLVQSGEVRAGGVARGAVGRHQQIDQVAAREHLGVVERHQRRVHVLGHPGREDVSMGQAVEVGVVARRLVVLARDREARREQLARVPDLAVGAAAGDHLTVGRRGGVVVELPRQEVALVEGVARLDLEVAREQAVAVGADADGGVAVLARVGVGEHAPDAGRDAAGHARGVADPVAVR